MGCFMVDQNRNGPFYLEAARGGGKMNHKLEAQTQKEIRKRALERPAGRVVRAALRTVGFVLREVGALLLQV